MKKQPQLTEQTKRNLETAFWSLYTNQSIEKIKIKDVTDLAGYNRGTFYLYYKDIYDLLDQIENRILTEIEEFMQELIQQADFCDFHNLIESLLILMKKYSTYTFVLQGEHGDPCFTARLKKVIWPLFTHFFIPATGYTPYQTELLAEFYLSGILSLTMKWNQNPQLSIQELAAFIIPAIFPKTDLLP